MALEGPQVRDLPVADLEEAGLNPTLVDLTPFALVRSLVPLAAPGTSEAIVSVGAGLTNVIVHTGGTPRLVALR